MTESIANGLTAATSEYPVTETIDRIVAVIDGLGWHLFARIDHAGQTAKKGLTLRPTELILFGNPAIGTRLMQECQLVAIDLPMKVLVWEDEQGQVRIAHNSLAWLQQRHGLTDSATLQAIDAVLAKLSAAVAGTTTQER